MSPGRPRACWYDGGAASRIGLHVVNTSGEASIHTIEQHVDVRFSYPVHFTTGLFELQNSTLADVVAGDRGAGARKLLSVVDEGLLQHREHLLESMDEYFTHHRNLIDPVCDPVIVPGGERVKNEPAHVAVLHSAINDFGVCRHSYLLVVGGGAVIDMAGYAAATAHRGVRLIRVPTTVLAQNDSAVGVKNAINFYGKKNFLGTFAPPWAVLNDFDFLATLPDRDWRAGAAEAVKVALLKDADFFAFLEENADALAQRNVQAMKRLIYRCAELHLHHIATSGDPFELGSSRPLDFGHWAAHKLEQLSGYALRHGEAVAIGLALDSTYSHLIGMLEGRDWKRILAVLGALGLPLYAPELSAPKIRNGRPSVLRGIEEFREHLGGRLTITLLAGIGDGIDVHEVDDRVLVESVELLRSYQAAKTVARGPTALVA